MTKKLTLILLLTGMISLKLHSQVKYGYAILYLRCGQQDPDRNRMYYSPVIELDRLNFDVYTKGVDPKIPKYSIRYYTYAIDKWFEKFLKEDHGIAINDIEKYERNATSVIFDGKANSDCNDDKTTSGCFFTDKNKLTAIREKSINDSRSALYTNTVCEVISLR